MSKTVKVIAHLEVDPQHLEFVMEVQREAVEYTLKEKGCIEYDLFYDPKAPHMLTFVEMWETPEDLQAHLTTPYFLEKGKRLEGMIVGKDVHIIERV